MQLRTRIPSTGLEEAWPRAHKGRGSFVFGTAIVAQVSGYGVGASPVALLQGGGWIASLLAM